MIEFLQLVVVGLSTGSAFALVGMSLVLVYRTTGIVNFAQGVFAVLGGLFTFKFSDDLPLVLAMLVAIVIAAVVSSALAVVAVGFRDRTTALASTIITLGAAFLAQALLLLEFGDIPRSYPGVSDRAWDVGGVLIQPQYVLIAGVALLGAAALTLFLRRTILGQALVACSDSRRASELVGLNIRSLAVVAFVGAGALCALGGALLAPSNPMTYSSDVAITVNGFAAAVFGGLGSIRLALLGGYALGILEQLVVGYIDPQYSLIIALILMLVLIGWRSRAEIASASHDVRASVGRARVPWPPWARIGLILGGAAFACWLPYQLSTFDVALYDRMGLYALVTIGLTLLMGYAGQISLGQGAFFLVGAYTSAILTVGIDADSRFVDPAAGIAPLLAVLAAPVVAAALAAVIGVPLLRLRGHYLAFATLALHLIAFSVLSAWDHFTGGQYGITVTKPLTVLGHELRGPLHAAVVWAVVAIALLLATNLVHSRVGRALQAIATDEVSAAASGVPVAAYKLRLFVFAAALAGLGGGLFTFSFLIVSPDAFPVVLSIQFVVMVAVGGLGNVYGAVVGTVAILYLEQKLRELGAQPDLFGWNLPDAAPTVFSFGVFGLILMAIMLFFPRGLLPAVSDASASAWSRARRRGGPGSSPPAPAVEQHSP
ncbi:MAG TPA: ABC transporter permease [Gaiellaceae bacterium]|nr:ABC transporter permease [Gaiellaceae bacterium]